MKKLLIAIVFLLSVSSLQAQKTTFWGKVNYFLTKPAVVDTTRIYQPKTGFSLGLFTTGQQAGFYTNVKFNIDLGGPSTTPGLTTYRLSENLCKKVGLEAGYGNVGLGYGFEVGHKSAWKKRSFAFNIIGKSWGVRFNYFKITNPFTSGLTIGNEGDSLYIHEEFSSDELAILRNFAIDGYYVFNNKRFAYPAAYKMGLVQRRTAGSWMLTARYMQGRLYNSPEAAMDSYNLLDCFSTIQASIGGGYSVNFVLWHRDPVGPRDEKLRNLTINLTAMPVITFVNYLKTTSYEYDDEGECSGEKDSKIWCYPMPNYIGSAAISLTMWRFYLSTQFTYNWFYFRSNDAFVVKKLDLPDYVEDLTYQGSFRDWTVKVLLVYRF
jgi:hypothetical protein